MLKSFANAHRWHRLNDFSSWEIYDPSVHAFVYDPEYANIKIDGLASFFLPNVIQQNNKIL